MLNITVTSKKLVDQKVDFFAFRFEEGFKTSAFSQALKEVSKKHFPTLGKMLETCKFKGGLLESKVFPFLNEKRFVHAACVGMGNRGGKKHLDIENYRRAIAQTYKLAQAHKAQIIGLQLPPASLFGMNVHKLAEQTSIALNMAAYHFDEFLSEKSQADPIDVIICVDAKSQKDAKKGVSEGGCIAQAVNKARHWVDMPPTLLTPPQLANKAQTIAKQNGLKLTVFSEKEIIKMGMGGLSGVSRGSDVECQLLVFEYRAKKKTAPTLAFVGKGITFDSGGLSLKPPTYMETMKEDMSGAAAVIATMEALAKLKPAVHVIGVTPLSENLPSGKATKPGDILRFYNGKTAEVKNTDAEGRLILADALSYVNEEYKPDAIIDVATLTGACAHALGPFYTGMMSMHDELVAKVEKAAVASGDHVWRLPMHDDYKVAIKSPVADLCNIGSQKYMAGATTAAHFLQNFVEDTPWVHLDIAGTAFNVPDRPYYRPGATGVGVRLLCELAMSYT